ASLLLFLDHQATAVHGDIIVDTLAAAPSPTVTSTITTAADGTISGPVNVEATRRFHIIGFVETSHGRMQTEIHTDIQFANRQRFDITAATYHQHIDQTTTISVRTGTEERGHHVEHVAQLDWPLTVDFVFASNPDGSAAQTTSIDQRFERSDTELASGGLHSFRIVSNHVAPSDTLNFNASGVFTGSTGQQSSQQFFSADSDGHCFSRDLTASGGLLTAVVDGQECGH